MGEAQGVYCGDDYCILRDILLHSIGVKGSGIANRLGHGALRHCSLCMNQRQLCV